MKTITIRAEAIAHNGCTHTNDVLRASLGSEHTEDTGTASNIEDDLVLEDVLVLNNGVHVGAGANLIFLSRSIVS